MKQTLLILFVLTISTLKVYSQTTEEEFNYATKGYGQQIESGLDPVKKGYRIEDIPVLYTFETGSKYSFKKLMKDDEGLKAIIIVTEMRGHKAYSCMPHPNTEKTLWDKAMKDINSKVRDINYAGLASALLRLSNYLAYNK